MSNVGNMEYSCGTLKVSVRVVSDHHKSPPRINQGMCSDESNKVIELYRVGTFNGKRTARDQLVNNNIIR